MKQLTLLNNKITYIEPDIIDVNKENIVFCHGFGADYFDFKPLVDLLSDKYNCFALNYPGHGKSKGSLFDMTLPFFANTVKAFVLKKKLKKVTLYGHSLGGGVVSYLEKEKFVDKIILEAPINPAIIGEEIKITSLIIPLAVGEYKNSVSKLVNQNKFADGIERKTFKHLLRTHTHMPTLIKDILSRKRIREMVWNFLNFKTKTLLVFGENDKLIPTKESIMWLKKMIKDIDVEIIKDSTHFPHVEKTEEVYKKIVSFMEKNKVRKNKIERSRRNR